MPQVSRCLMAQQTGGVFEHFPPPRYSIQPPIFSQGKFSQAEPLYVRVIEIWEKVYGPDHPLLATALSNQAVLLCNAQVRDGRIWWELLVDEGTESGFRYWSCWYA